MCVCVCARARVCMRVHACVHSGLWDPYNDQHMGMCAEQTAKQYQISREDQVTASVMAGGDYISDGWRRW